MPDTKITALAAITTVAPSNDLFPIVDVSDNSMAASGTTKNITVNQLLGAGGIAALSSATITGDLTVDTNTLKVDSANNRVGILTASPAYPLSVAGRISYSTGIGEGADLTVSSSGTSLQFGLGSSWTQQLWYLAGAEAMRLNSTGLGVGVTPGSGKIAARAGTAATGNSLYADNIDGTYNPWIQIQHSSAGIKIFNSSSFGGSSNNLIFGNGTTSETMRIDSSGNVGIGVTPSAWTTYSALQIRNGSIANYSPTQDLRISSNAYYASGIWKRIAAAFATQYLQDGSSGLHQWYVAATGAADSTITTFTTAAMTLDASGNLLVGTTSAGGNRLNVQTASGDCTALIKSQAANVGVTIDYVSNYGNFNFSKSGTAKWSLGILNDSASTPTFKLFNDAAVGVYVTYGGTSWTATSDERLKDIIEPISNAVAKVGSLRSVIGKFKTDSEGTRRSFLIAQDVQSVLPEAVDASNPDKLGVAYSEVIPLLVAAIKELTARVQTLETR